MELRSLFPTAQSLDIVFPDGEPTGITLKITTNDTAAVRAVDRKAAQATLNAGGKLPVSELESLGHERITASIIGWEGLTENGEPIPYSAAKALELMSNPSLSFIADQVERFASKRANFFRRDATAA